MRISVRFALLSSLLAVVAVVAVACRTAPPPPAPVVVPLTTSANAALQWIDAHAVPFSLADSLPSAAERTQLAAIAGDARVVGISELTEGTREFPRVVGHLLFSLAEAKGARALAIQAPMAEALEVDRYVRTGNGDPRRLLHQLASWRWETPEMLSLVNSIREWNRTHPVDRQIGFAGFEIPTATHAVQVVNSLPDSLAGPALKAWFRREYTCVLSDESARFGREGRTSDSTFWRRCGTVATAAVDSIVALRQRSTAARSAQMAFVEQNARLVQHHVTVGLRYLTRQDANAEHVLYVANSFGLDARILVWGGDVEMGRITLDQNTVQTAQSLHEKIGARFRNIAFLVGRGTVRARPGGFSRSGQPLDLTSVPLRLPTDDLYENVLLHATQPSYWLDLTALPSDSAGAYLRGPHGARLVIEEYRQVSPQAYETPLEFPKFFDALVFVREVSATR